MHTPGPWQIRSDRGIEGKSSYGMWKNICDKVRGGSPAEAAANARLIAAAPELLEAVTLFQRFFDEMPKGQFAHISCDAGLMNDAFLMAARAIAKAKGKS